MAAARIHPAYLFSAQHETTHVVYVSCSSLLVCRSKGYDTVVSAFAMRRFAEGYDRPSMASLPSRPDD